MITITELIDYIEEQTGKRFVECSVFSGMRKFQDEFYYNLEINERYSESQEIVALERLTLNSSVVSRIEPNGHKRVAIFLKKSA